MSDTRRSAADRAEQVDHDPAGWRTVRHYAYVERPYAAVVSKLASAPRRVLGDRPQPSDGAGLAELPVRRAGVDVSRAVKVTFGELTSDENLARMAVRWEDDRHPRLFPVLKGFLSLAPVRSSRRQVTQVGLVGRYRPPFGALGGAADRVAGEDVAVDSAAGFVNDVAHRLESLVGAEPLEPDTVEDAAPRAGVATAGHRRILVPLDRLDDRDGGAVAVSGRLAGTPGVVRSQVDPVAGMAEVEYDPQVCSLDRLLAEIDVEDTR